MQWLSHHPCMPRVCNGTRRQWQRSPLRYMGRNHPRATNQTLPDMERSEMATETETQREIRDGFVRIANKWLRGREEIARLQGSSFVIAGQSAAQRQMLNLMAEVTRDMERFLGAGHSPD